MQHILVIRLSAMGDVAMTVPVIRALIQQHPEVKITVVSRPFFAPFFKDIPRVSFFGADLKKRHKGFWGLYRLFRDLSSLHIDAVADLHNVLRSKIIRTFFKLTGTKIAFTDKGRKEKKALVRAENKVFKPVKTMVARHAETFNRLGFPVKLAQNLPFDRKNMQPPVINFAGQKTTKWIGIAPFAQYATKVYPPDLMKEVIRLLAENTDYTLFLFGGGEKERMLLEEMVPSSTRVKVVIGALSFEEELVLIQHLDLMLSMDSGNAHIAAMYQVPTITLWGHTHPYAGFAPFGQPEANSITSDRKKYPLLPTSVYGNKTVTGYEEVMRTILPQQIVIKIKETIG